VKQETKTEAAAVKTDDKAPAMKCCSHANAACCTNKTATSSKECTPAQKAACEKAGGKAKADASTPAKSGSN
jgi:hypothetical protein